MVQIVFNRPFYDTVLNKPDLIQRIEREYK